MLLGSAARAMLFVRMTRDAAQLIRIARLRRFVGVFARGGDREATAAALASLSAASQANGFAGDALLRARQAAELLCSDDDPEPRARSLLHLGAVCLDTGDGEASIAAAELAAELAATLEEPIRSQLIGCASLLGGIAHSLDGDDARARAAFDDARERMVAAEQPEGAALALTQQGLLDVAAGRPDAAELCFRFAQEFYRRADRAGAVAEVSALAARALAEAGLANVDRWYVEAIADADATGSARLAAELVVERALRLERDGLRDEALAMAADAARRCKRLADSRELVMRARLVSARLTADPGDVLRHLEAAFEIALDVRDPEALGGVMEVVVTALVNGGFASSTGAGWRLVDRFRERLGAAGFAHLADAATVALVDLRE